MVRKLLRAALIAGVAITASTPAEATQWGAYHWATTNGILAVRVNYSITAAVWGSSVSGAISDWDNGATSFGIADHLTLNPQISSADRRKCSPVSGQILVCNYSYGYRGWLGIANIWTSGDHILQATTRLNDSYFNLTAYNTPAWRNMVACQEIGHDYGLGHQDETNKNYNLGTCMDYTNAPQGGTVDGFVYGPNNEHPNIDDFISLNSAGMYGHFDATSTATFAASATNFGIRAVGQAAPSTGDAPGGLSKAEWGTPIHRDAKGRADTFVRQLGGGHKLLTHVFWAIEATGHESD
ncbi:MAG: hypothetical protein ABIQ98_07675 [Sphingomicrobium sp.]